MQHATLQWNAQQQIAQLSGVLDFTQVQSLLCQAKNLFAPLTAKWQLDFKDVKHSNSAGLALIFALQRQAQSQHTTLVCLNVPAALSAAAKISHVEHLL